MKKETLLTLVEITFLMLFIVHKFQGINWLLLVKDLKELVERNKKYDFHNGNICFIFIMISFTRFDAFDKEYFHLLVYYICSNLAF